MQWHEIKRRRKRSDGNEEGRKDCCWGKKELGKYLRRKGLTDILLK